MQTRLGVYVFSSLVILTAFVACGDDGQRRDRDDDDAGEGGESGSPSPGVGGTEPAAGRGAATGGDSSGSGGTVSTSGRDGGSGDDSGGNASGATGGSGAAGGEDPGGAGDGNGAGESGSGASGGTGGANSGGSAGASAGSGGASAGSGGSAGSSAGSGGSGGACGVISIDPLSHHLGDGDGSEGTTLSRSFRVDCKCEAPTLALQMDGPNYEAPPRISLNGSQLPSLQSFFPPISSDDVWQTGTSAHDYNGYLQIHYDVSGGLSSGSNTFTITNGTASDDYNFQDVRIECGTWQEPGGPDIVNRGGWVGYYDDRAGDNPAGIQGAFYAYDDGVSCTSPTNPCTSGACCLSGTTLGSSPGTYWGCGLGLQLNSSGGTTPTESAYSGPADCFELEVTGNSGGSEVRLQIATHVDMSARTAPIVSLGVVNGPKTATVCLDDFTCPASPPSPCTLSGEYYRFEMNVVGGVTAGAFGVCLQSFVPQLRATSTLP